MRLTFLSARLHINEIADGYESNRQFAKEQEGSDLFEKR